MNQALLSSPAASAANCSQMMRPSSVPGRVAFTPILPRFRCAVPAPQVQCNAGFGSSSGKSEKKKPRFTRYLDDEDANAAASAEVSDWIELDEVDAVQSFVSKPIKPIILKTGKAIMLYKVGEQIFCSDANSTAFQYPLADGNILGLKTGPAIESKLDGTVYDLASGKVLSWCPKNNPVRSLLGTLKDKQNPVDLKVYPVRVEGKKVLVKITA